MDLYWIRIHHRLPLGDGVDGTNLWRTIPLGLGVFLPSVPKVSQLYYRYFCRSAPTDQWLIRCPRAGWMSVLAWQAGSASGSFLTGTIIQGLISVRDPSYEPQRWQGTLFVFAMVLVIYIANVYGSDLMPVLNNLLMVFHVVFWAVVLIVLWAMAPHRSAEAVFVTGWENFGGWSTMGLSVMIGQISAIYGSLSSDATAHMSEVRLLLTFMLDYP